jgi:DNA-binding transcriptional MocR family regulator
MARGIVPANGAGTVSASQRTQERTPVKNASERSQALQQAAAIHWSDFLVMPRIESGLDTAVLLRPRIDDRAAAAAAARANIELRPLWGHSQRRPRLRGFVVGFAAVDPRSIFDGCRRLARILEEQISLAPASVSGH